MTSPSPFPHVCPVDGTPAVVRYVLVSPLERPDVALDRRAQYACAVHSPAAEPRLTVLPARPGWLLVIDPEFSAAAAAATPAPLTDQTVRMVRVPAYVNPADVAAIGRPPAAAGPATVEAAIAAMPLGADQ